MKTSKIIIGLLAASTLFCGFIFLQKQNTPVSQSPAMVPIKWHTFQEAVELNKKVKKKIFIDVYTDWCGWCKVMDKNTFTNPVIAKYMNEKYYAVKLNAEMKDSVRFNNYTFINPSPNTPRSTHQLASSLLNNQLSYPSFVFLDENFSILSPLPGYKSPDQFEPFLKFFGDNSYLTVKYDDFMSTFKGEIPPPPAQPVAPPIIPH